MLTLCYKVCIVRDWEKIALWRENTKGQEKKEGEQEGEKVKINCFFEQQENQRIAYPSNAYTKLLTSSKFIGK